MRYVYPCILRPEEGGGYYVVFPDVPGALTSGKDRGEALEMGEDALVAALGAHWQLHQEVPLPSPVGEGEWPIPLPTLAAAKLALYKAMREQGMSNSALAERLRISEDALEKLINPDYGSHLSHVEKALRVLGRSLVVEDVGDYQSMARPKGSNTRAMRC